MIDTEEKKYVAELCSQIVGFYPRGVKPSMKVFDNSNSSGSSWFVFDKPFYVKGVRIYTYAGNFKPLVLERTFPIQLFQQTNSFAEQYEMIRTSLIGSFLGVEGRGVYLSTSSAFSVEFWGYECI